MFRHVPLLLQSHNYVRNSVTSLTNRTWNPSLTKGSAQHAFYNPIQSPFRELILTSRTAPNTIFMER